ncbi:hypothetical protein ATANTOWER_007640 [Ataeniobius toweri]|uniref:Uncharacterized protein n=1 Tax=Ataeniobius toweri TaxID=208326 RepID=A0ABU7AYF2_9TELE|nr:hypothetical protein [Ataeniobius toweri]
MFTHTCPHTDTTHTFTNTFAIASNLSPPSVFLSSVCTLEASVLLSFCCLLFFSSFSSVLPLLLSLDNYSLVSLIYAKPFMPLENFSSSNTSRCAPKYVSYKPCVP